MSRHGSLHAVPAQQASTESVEEGTAANASTMSQDEQDPELNEIERIEKIHTVKILGPSYSHALACTACKILHPLDDLEAHWKTYHPRVRIGDGVIRALKEAGAWSKGFPLPAGKVLAVPELEDAQRGWWCPACRKASHSHSTVRHSLQHQGCLGTISESLVQKISHKNLYWAVFERERSPGSLEVPVQGLEDEVQEQLNLLPDVISGDRIIITNPRNITQFLDGTEWLDILGQKPYRPVISLVELPKIKDRKTGDRCGEYPALSTFVERYLESLLGVLHSLPSILRQWLNTTDGYVRSFKSIRGAYPYPHRAAVSHQMLRRHQNTETIKKYAVDGTKLLLMTLRYTNLPSEDRPLEICFLPSQEEAANVLHGIFHHRPCNTVDEIEAMESIQGLFASLFFPQVQSETQGRHSPLHCFFLAASLRRTGQFKPARSLTPLINHVDYILRLIACKELENSTKR